MLGTPIVDAALRSLPVYRSPCTSRRLGYGVLHVADTKSNLAFNPSCRSKPLLSRIPDHVAKPLLHRAQYIRDAAFELVPVHSNLRVNCSCCAFGSPLPVISCTFQSSLPSSLTVVTPELRGFRTALEEVTAVVPCELTAVHFFASGSIVEFATEVPAGSR